MVIILSLCSAVAYGLSDFVGGVLARRASAWAVAAVSQATAAIMAAGFVAIGSRDADTNALAWGVLAGVGSGAGNVLIYRGLAAGRMAVVAPVSAVAAAALPVLVGIIGGERPSVFASAGVVVALPAIWLVSGGGSGARGGTSRGDLINGLSAGAGFGVQFSALGQIPSESGLLPLTVSQVTSVIVIVAAAAWFGAQWMPRDRFSRLGAIPGVLAGAATICFQLAVQAGLLTIAGVLASLYPAMTVLLAATILRERIHRSQGVGLACAAATVVLIASG